MRITLNFRANVLEGDSPCRRGTVGSAEASLSDALQDSARKCSAIRITGARCFEGLDSDFGCICGMSEVGSVKPSPIGTDRGRPVGGGFADHSTTDGGREGLMVPGMQKSLIYRRFCVTIGERPRKPVSQKST